VSTTRVRPSKSSGDGKARTLTEWMLDTLSERVPFG